MVSIPTRWWLSHNLPTSAVLARQEGAPMPAITPHPTPAQFRLAPWLEWAFLALGEHRIPGTQHNPVVVDFLRTVGLGNGDETAWCSAFANWCMRQAGIPGSGSALARSWLTWGNQALARPGFGCVTILWRGDPASQFGHVGFYVGRDGSQLLLLGGNQTNSSRVTISPYPENRLLGYRWPAGYPLAPA
jgi:uncharacterized protein (TIGR02594 family)